MAPPPPPHDGDEPRVRDLLRARAEPDTGAGDDAGAATELDDGALAAWFERPSFAHLAELAAGTPAPPGGRGARDDDDPELAAIKARRAAVTAQVDPALLERLYRHAHYDPTRLPPPLPGVDERPSILAFDEAAIPAPPDPNDPDQWRQYERGDAIDDDLRVNTPQAFLRDLHRPVTEFYISHEPAFGDLEDAGSLDVGARAVRDVLTTRYEIDTISPDFAPATHKITEAYRDRRGLMALPWADAKSPRGKRREAELEAELARKVAEAAAVAQEPGTSPAKPPGAHRR
jgi:hypothetical protein